MPNIAPAIVDVVRNFLDRDDDDPDTYQERQEWHLTQPIKKRTPWPTQQWSTGRLPKIISLANDL